MTSPTPVPDLAVAVCTRDNMRTIERTLQSVQGLARRVVVVDSGSKDGTVERCRDLGAEVMHRAWPGPTDQKQFAMDRCRDHAWVLLLDSDESLEDDLRTSIAETLRTDDPRYVGWSINRKVWMLGGWLHHTFQPEWRLRLVRGGQSRVVGIGPGGKGGHDRVEVDGRTGRLDGVCRHDSWVDLGDLARRNIALAKRAGAYQPHGGTLFSVLVSPPAALLKQLVLKQGFRDGWRGLIAAGAVASGALLKHLFIAERRSGLKWDEPGATPVKDDAAPETEKPGVLPSSPRPEKA